MSENEPKIMEIDDEEPGKTEVKVEEVTESPDGEWLDILGSGGILKQTVKAGTGNKPAFGEEVKCKIVQMNLQTGEVLKSEDNATFRVGENDVAQVIDLVLPLMEEGEKCNLKVHSKFGYGGFGSIDKKIPPNTNLAIQIEFLAFGAPPPDLRKISAEDRVALALKKKERGNEHYKMKNLQAAFKSYQLGTSILETELPDEHAQDTSNGITNLLAICYNNMCQVQISTGQFKLAKETVEKVLVLEPKNLKALVRKTTVLKEFQEYVEGKKIIAEILKIDPNYAGALKMNGELDQLIAQQNKKQAEIFGKVMNQSPKSSPQSSPKPGAKAQAPSSPKPAQGHSHGHGHSHGNGHSHGQPPPQQKIPTPKDTSAFMRTTSLDQDKSLYAEKENNTFLYGCIGVLVLALCLRLFLGFGGDTPVEN